jgi:hypothetical protein
VAQEVVAAAAAAAGDDAGATVEEEADATVCSPTDGRFVEAGAALVNDGRGAETADGVEIVGGTLGEAADVAEVVAGAMG